MKKILLLLFLFITAISLSQTGTTSAGKFKAMTATKDNTATRVVVQDSITKEYRWVLKSSLGSGSIPTLQQVTEAGALTNVGLGISDGTNFTALNPNGEIFITGVDATTFITPSNYIINQGDNTVNVQAGFVSVENSATQRNLTLETTRISSNTGVSSNTSLQFPATQGNNVILELPVLPSNSNRKVPVSVNGNFADSAGNITISGGSGTVTQFNFTNANGVTGAVTNSTTTPTLVLSLGAITPTTVMASGNITGTNLSGTNTGDNAVNSLYSGLEASKQDKLLSITQNTNYVLTNNTNPQQIFNITGNTAGELTLQAGATYDFEMFVDLSNLSSISGFFSFSIGGTATYSSLRLRTSSTKNALVTTGDITGVTTSINAYQLTTANTQTVGTIFIKGRINVNAAGTIQPRITLSQGSAANVLPNSYLNITKL